MHREIGDHADVALEQPEIHADRIVVVDMTQLSALDDLRHLADGAGVNERVVHDQHPFAAVGFGYQLARLQRSFGHRLFEPKVLAGLQHRHPELEMRMDWCRHGDGID